MRFLPVLLAGLVLLSVSAFSPAASAQGYYEATGQRINEVRVLGNERIEASTILTYMDVRVGDNMTEDTLDRGLKSLFGTGLFADVTLRQRGNVLEVTVVENPVINEVAFEGNDKIKDEQLMAEVQARPRQVLTRNKIQTDVNRLYQVYQRNGRFSVNIEPKIIKLDQNRVNLVFEITEGEVTVVRVFASSATWPMTMISCAVRSPPRKIAGIVSSAMMTVMIRTASNMTKSSCVVSTCRRVMRISVSFRPRRSFPKSAINFM